VKKNKHAVVESTHHQVQICSKNLSTMTVEASLMDPFAATTNSEVLKAAHGLLKSSGVATTKFQTIDVVD